MIRSECDQRIKHTAISIHILKQLHQIGEINNLRSLLGDQSGNQNGNNRLGSLIPDRIFFDTLNARGFYQNMGNFLDLDLIGEIRQRIEPDAYLRLIEIENLNPVSLLKH